MVTLAWLDGNARKHRSARSGSPRPPSSNLHIELLERRDVPSSVVYDVSGDLFDGGSITISGIDFGSFGPDIANFDHFDWGAVGNQIYTGPGSAPVGEWFERNPYGSITYSSENWVSGSQSARGDMTVHWASNVTALLPEWTQDVFVSYWVLIPEGTRWPGEGNPDQINFKRVWLQGRNSTDDDRMLPADLGYAGSSDPVSWVLGCNNCPQGPAWFDSSITRGTWLRTWVYVQGRTDNTGALHVWELTESGVVQRLNANNIPTLYAEGCGVAPCGFFERVVMNSYGRQTQNSFPTFDDFYVATGPAARARVEIVNSPTYLTGTKMAILTPTAWGDTTIEATFWQGPFSPGEVAYVFVVSADGVPSEEGYPIVIGGGGAPHPGGSDSPPLDFGALTALTTDSAGRAFVNVPAGRHTAARLVAAAGDDLTSVGAAPRQDPSSSHADMPTRWPGKVLDLLYSDLALRERAADVVLWDGLVTAQCGWHWVHSRELF